jgi:hypothetical protein
MAKKTPVADKSVVASQGGGASKAMTTLDAQLSGEIANLKETLGAPSGNKIKVIAAPQGAPGAFETPEGQNLGDEIQIVVIDYISRNTYYSSPYNANNIVPPDCYALGRIIKDMAPEDDSPVKQNEVCSTCPQNAFGSGANGSSKACSNRYWLASLLVDQDNPDAHNAPDAPMYLIDLAPTSRKAFEGYVTGVARSLNGPPIKAIVTLRASGAGTYSLVSFHDVISNPDYAEHFKRRGEAEAMLTRRPDFTALVAQPTKRGQPARRGPVNNRPAARR